MSFWRVSTLLSFLVLSTQAYGLGKAFEMTSIWGSVGGDFTLKFEDKDTKSKITLTDGEGLAALAVLQVILVNELNRVTPVPKRENEVARVLKKGGADLLKVQKSALDKAIQFLQKQLDDAKHPENLHLGGVMLSKIVKKLRASRARMESKDRPWTIQDGEDLGELIKSLTPNATDYRVDIEDAQENVSRRIANLLGKDFLDGGMNEASYTLFNAGGYSKSRPYIYGDGAALYQQFSRAKAMSSPGDAHADKKLMGKGLQDHQDE